MSNESTQFTPEQERCIAAAIQRGKSDIRLWIAQGWVPPTVTSFSELQDFQDANTAGGLCEEGGQFDAAFPTTTPDEREIHLHAANNVQAALDEWLSSEGNDRNRPIQQRGGV
ncbi:hypothetical protein RN01_05140 [Cupriavidus sp. SHE]|uniref:hypothetical protein n=1 Tax=Cupriavidus TaxID=106589 RepID=UPI00068C0D53|nr:MULTISPECIES: hypothetical protein [Cupriavidus]KWR85410.1 hypothetical protein RN01_05140 [Cupriavidus sp. SHE]GMG94633.1 hypothetical protein Cmtc_58530 [Cupriavidus sp. TKC]